MPNWTSSYERDIGSTCFSPLLNQFLEILWSKFFLSSFWDSMSWKKSGSESNNYSLPSAGLFSGQKYKWYFFSSFGKLNNKFPFLPKIKVERNSKNDFHDCYVRKIEWIMIKKINFQFILFPFSIVYTCFIHRTYRFIPISPTHTCVYQAIRRPWFIYDLQ